MKFHVPLCFSIVVLALSGAIAGDYPKAPIDKNPVDLNYELNWSPHAIFGFHSGDDFREGSVEFLIPMYGTEDSLLFLYPKLGLISDIDPNLSLGLGGRRYIEAWDAIIGGSIFFDHFETIYGNDFNQLGLGAEVLTRWVDFRFNYYLPESNPQLANSFNVNSRVRNNRTRFGTPFGQGFTVQQRVAQRTQVRNITQLFQNFEDASDGFDTEIGFLVPYLEQFTEVRVFGGYYNFDGQYGNDVKGGRGRAEWRLSPRFALEAAYYEDEEVTGDNWTFGFRVNLPIQDGPNAFGNTVAGLFREESHPSTAGDRLPFSYWTHAALPVGNGGTRDVQERMTEEILRNTGLQTDESGFVENLPARTSTLVKNKSKTRIVVVDDSVVFVDNVNGSAAGSGSFEDPVNAIQSGVDTASLLFSDNGDVIVAGRGTTYTESVDASANSVRIWGSEKGFPALGGRRLTYGTTPVVEGSFSATDIPEFLVSGFTLVEGDDPLIAIDNVGNATIICNTFDTTDEAIELDYDDGAMHTILISDNNFLAGLDTAIDIDTEDTDLMGTISDNVFEGGSEAIYQYLDGGMTKLAISNNTFNDFDSEAILVEIEDSSDPGSGYDIFGNSFTGNETGISIQVYDHDDGNISFRTHIEGNTFTDNDVAAEHYFAYDNDSDDLYLIETTFDLIGNTFIGSNSQDIWQHGDSDSDADDGEIVVRSRIEGNTFSNNEGSESILIEVSDWDDEDLSITVDVIGNTFMNLAGSGYVVDVADIDLDSDVVHVTTTVRGNTFDGVSDDAINIEVSDEADLVATVANNTIRNIGGSAIVVTNNSDPSSATVGGNMIETVAGTGIELNSLDIGSGTFGNNIVTGAGTVFDINDSDGQVLINGVLEP